MKFWCFLSILSHLSNWQGLANPETVIEVFEDYGCKKSLGNVQTSLIAIDGDCIAVPKGAHSVRPIHIDTPCAVTLYPDDCSEKNATLAPLDICTAMNVIDTLSVDCTALSTQSSWTAKSTKYADSTKSSSKSSTVSSQQAALKSRSSLHRSLTFMTSSSSPITFTGPRRPLTQSEATLSTTETTQSPTASSTSPTNGGRTTDSNLSKGGEVAIGVVVPAVGVIVAVIFGINSWSRKANRESGQTGLPGSEARGTGSMTERGTGARRVASDLSSNQQVTERNGDMNREDDR